jgi:hypothetical protein
MRHVACSQVIDPMRHVASPDARPARLGPARLRLSSCQAHPDTGRHGTAAPDGGIARQRPVSWAGRNRNRDDTAPLPFPGWACERQGGRAGQGAPHASRQCRPARTARACLRAPFGPARSEQPVAQNLLGPHPGAAAVARPVVVLRRRDADSAPTRRSPEN